MNANRIIKSLTVYHGGQSSASYALLSSLISLRDKKSLTVDKMYSLPWRESYKEISSLYNTTNTANLSKRDLLQWQTLLRNIKLAISWIDSRRSLFQQKFYYKNNKGIQIWAVSDVPWYFNVDISSGVTHVIYVPINCENPAIDFVKMFDSKQYITTYDINYGQIKIASTQFI